MRKIYYCGKPWVAGKAEPISPRVAASRGEPMLGCNIGWTRRGVPFWEDNRSDGTMVPSWKRSGPISQGGYSTYCGKSAPYLPRLCEPTASQIEKWGNTITPQ